MTKEKLEEICWLIDQAINRVEEAKKTAEEYGVRLHFSLLNKEVYALEGIEILAEAASEEIKDLPISTKESHYIGLKANGYEFWNLVKEGEKENV